jgi:hypothetical protein
MGIASRTKWARRKATGGRIRNGWKRSDYAKTIRKQAKLK